jgi:hypothetical protein
VHKPAGVSDGTAPENPAENSADTYAGVLALVEMLNREELDALETVVETLLCKGRGEAFIRGVLRLSDAGLQALQRCIKEKLKKK